MSTILTELPEAASPWYGYDKGKCKPCRSAFFSKAELFKRQESPEAARHRMTRIMKRYEPCRSAFFSKGALFERQESPEGAPFSVHVRT